LKYFNTDKLTANLTSKSLFHFIKHFWDTLNPGQDFIANWHIPLLCKELEIVAKRVHDKQDVQYDLIINVPPGSTKSTICSVCFPAWLWTWFPEARIVCGSRDGGLSMELSMKCREVITSDEYKRLFPDMVLAKFQDAKGYYINNRQGARYSTSTGSSPIGRHYHFIMTDDPLSPADAFSEPALKEANRWQDHTLPSRSIDKRITQQITIMQRLHEEDCTGHRLSQKLIGRPVKHICLPAETYSGFQVSPPEWKQYYQNDLLDPIRLPRHILEQEKVRMGLYQYSGQYGQKPAPQEGALFLVKNIRIVELLHYDNKGISIIKDNQMTNIPIESQVVSWDKSSGIQTGAYCVGMHVAKLTNGQYIILEVIRGLWETYEREQVILNTAKRIGKHARYLIEQEPGSGGSDSAKMTVQNLAGYNVLINKESQNKVARAQPFAAQVNGNNVLMAKASWNQALIDEMLYFPNSKYKDQVDAGSAAFNYLFGNIRRVGAF
jgi:predicted phage terminase large subunit-like protein